MDNYIDITFSSRQETCTVKSIYQYDIGRTLRIHGVSNESLVQVHYCIPGMLNAIQTEPDNADGIYISRIPNVFAIQTKPIHAYVYVTQEDNSQTIMDIVIPIIERPKPDGFSYTEDEIKGYDYIVQQLKEAVDTVESLNTQTTHAASSARTSGQTADKAATRASLAAQDASRAATAANIAAAEVAQSIEDAANAAQNAQNEASKAANSAQTAADAANEAAKSAENAVQNSPQITNDYIEHIVLETIDVDATLSVDGKVADAAAVGRAIASLTEEIEKIKQQLVATQGGV